MADTFRTPYVTGKLMKVPAVNRKPRPFRMATMRGGLAALPARESVQRAYPPEKPQTVGSLMMGKRKKK